jgi:hypothetical protein
VLAPAANAWKCQFDQASAIQRLLCMVLLCYLCLLHGLQLPLLSQQALVMHTACQPAEESSPLQEHRPELRHDRLPGQRTAKGLLYLPGQHCRCQHALSSDAWKSLGQHWCCSQAQQLQHQST